MSTPTVVNGATTPLPMPVDDRLMSRLPVVDQPWPPPAHEPIADTLRMWDAWWTGDREQLAYAYSNPGGSSTVGRSYFSTTGEAGTPGQRPGQARGGVPGSNEYWFWGQNTPPGEKMTKTHVPIAGDIAQTSASLLFSKPPSLRSTLDDKKAAALNNAWFDSQIDDHFHTRLLEAAEMCAAHGGVYLRVVWDREVRDKPWIVAVPADVAVPEWRYDVLGAVTFWQTLSDDGSVVVRHLEKHVPGSNVILHGLYQGDQTDLGEPISLNQHPVTARFANDPAMAGGTIHFPDQPLDAASVVYIPNLTPNRIWRRLGPQAWPLGRSDFSGVEGLMDNLDEAYSSWMRDIRLAKSRIIIPNEYMDSLGRGQGAVFDPERQAYSPLNMLHDDSGGAKDITLVQFLIRWQEHQQTCVEWTNKIVAQAGYSAQTFGDYAGEAITATEVTARERKSNGTRGKKINYWCPKLQDIIYGLMTIERTYFGNKLITPERPEIQFIDTIAPSMMEMAQTAALLETANAASMQVKVQLVHPDWTPKQVDDEVALIFAETGAEMAAHAKLALAAPMGTPLPDEVAGLAELTPVPPVTTPVPGDEPGQSSTGDEN